MATTYPNNPYYNLLLFFLIKYRLTETDFKKNLFLSLDDKAQQEILTILTRNKRLMLLEKHKPGFSDKKPINHIEYYQLDKENVELVHGMIVFLSEKQEKPIPDFEYKIPTLFDLSARVLSIYATKQNLFSNVRTDISKKTKKIAILAKQQPWYKNALFGKKYSKPFQNIPVEVFEKFMSFYQSKTTLEQIKQKYEKINQFCLLRHFSFNEYYFNSIANFLLECALNKDNIEFPKKMSVLDSYGNHETFGTLNGITPLHIACELDAPISLIAELIANGDKVNDPKRNNNWTPLHQACLFNASLDLIDELLKHGARLTATELSHQATPLHIACHLGHDNLALHLLKKGAPMDLKVCSPIALSIEEYFYYFQATALHLALEANCKETIKYLVEKKFDFSQVTTGKVHVFHLACQYANPKIVKLLSEKIEKPCMEDKNKLNPADYALINTNEKNRLGILKILKNLKIEPTKSVEEIRKIVAKRIGAIDYGTSHSHHTSINYSSYPFAIR